MYSLLVVDRDDCFLPRGWVSAVLPPGRQPSEYERSGKLWRVVEVPEKPKLAPRPRRRRGEKPAPSKALRFDSGRLIELADAAAALDARLSLSSSQLKPLPGPGVLDRSHSTVWDYGPGRTYSTPQAADDALYAQVGSTDFTEVHYLRGWSDTYEPGITGAVLSMEADLHPSLHYPLVIDAAPGQTVIMSGDLETGGIVAERGNHVHVAGLRFESLFAGIAVVAPETVAGWRIQECVFDGAVGEGLLIGIGAYDLLTLSIRDCIIRRARECGVYLEMAMETQLSALEVTGCVVEAADESGVGLWTAFYQPFVFVNLVNNTIVGPAACWKDDSETESVFPTLLNNIFHGSAPGADCLRLAYLGPDSFFVRRSDGNCFHPGAGGSAADLNGTTLALAGLREWFHEDEHSFAADPLLDDELKPGPGSPCRGAGVNLDDAGLEGNRRAESVDVGAWQVTSDQVPHVAARLAPEIARRK